MKLITFYKMGPNGREFVKEFDKDIILPLKNEEIKFEGDETVYNVVRAVNIYNEEGNCRLEYELVESGEIL